MTETRSIEIPLQDSDEVIELDLTELPDVKEVLGILTQEKTTLNIWITLALEYWRQKKVEDFKTLLENARNSANLEYQDHEKDQMTCLDTLAASYVQQARKEKSKDKRQELFMQATQLYTMADKIIMYDKNHLLGRACFCLLEGNKMDQADAQFNFVLNQSPDNIPSLLGKACISFNKKDYKQALQFYKKVLRINPNCPADVRLGMGHCFYKLGNLEKARLAFSRCLQLDNKNVGAIVGMAVLDINSNSVEKIRKGTTMLSTGYRLDSTNPMVLNRLADHFFFKKAYDRVKHLALHAYHNTENEAIQAESCYQLARSFHAEGDYDQAFQYYYQSFQFASPTFVLPHFGLGQMYLAKKDGNDQANKEKACNHFEIVLKTFPDNYETMKILASLYCESDDPEKLEKAKKFFKKVTENQPEDVEAWVELAQLLERQPSSNEGVQGALKAYGKATMLIRSKVEQDIPPEILNNIAGLHFRLGNFNEAKRYYQRALDMCKKDPDNKYLSSIMVTIQYNMGRVHESLFQFNEAENIYKDVLRTNNKYIDCCLRLGCMKRDLGSVFDASNWFKEAINLDNHNADAWSLFGNMHCKRFEWHPGQKKFERILKQNDKDVYSKLALGNIWLQTLHNPHKDKEREKRHQQRALQMYKKVLKDDPKNIFAANGIGAVLAHQGHVREARDIFAQVREATADVCDVWVNLAHVYMEQRQYLSAVQMYDSCMRKFHKRGDPELLVHLARAQFKCGKLAECKKTLLRARHVAPHDTAVLYNVSCVLMQVGKAVLVDEKSNLQTVLIAISDLKLAQDYFTYLSTCGDRMKFDLKQAATEASRCRDLLSQANNIRQRAQTNEEAEKKMKEEQEKKKQIIRQKQEQEKRNKMLAEEERMRALMEQRQLTNNKVKQLNQNEFVNTDKEKKKSHKRKKQTNDDIGMSSSDEEGQQSSNKKRKKPTKKRKIVENTQLSQKQQAKIKSKEVISDSDSSVDSSDNEEPMPQSDNDVLPDVSSSSEDNQDEDNVRGESPAPKKRAKMLESSSDEDGDQGFNQQQQEEGSGNEQSEAEDNEEQMEGQEENQESDRENQGSDQEVANSPDQDSEGANSPDAQQHDSESEGESRQNIQNSEINVSSDSE